MELQPVRIVAVSYLTILLSLTVHEYAHGWMAYRLGDDTAKRQGRLTLNPIVIIQHHTMGALIFPLIGSLFGMPFGWASCPVNLANVRRDVSLRRANFLISIAGPMSNVLLAIIAGLTLVGLSAAGLMFSGGMGGAEEPIKMLLYYMILLNVLLALFNLLPVPPLDGYSVLESMVSRSQEHILKFLREYQMILFIVVLMYGGRLFAPVIQYVVRVFIDLARSVA
ncbi:MAG: site-2 protease family protein [Bradymonadia bacterium]